MEKQLQEIKEYVENAWENGYIGIGVYADLMRLLGVIIDED